MVRRNEIQPFEMSARFLQPALYVFELAFRQQMKTHWPWLGMADYRKFKKRRTVLPAQKSLG